MATPTKRPTGAVTSLAVARQNGRYYKATWKIPPALVKDSAKDHATQFVVQWSLGIAGTDPKRTDTKKGTNVTEFTVNLDSLKMGSTTYTRNSFYPVNDKRRLSYVTCVVTASNLKGNSPKHAKVTYKFAKPKKPSIGAFSLGENTGIVSTTINTPADAGQYERYDTEYYFIIKRSDTKQVLRNVHATSGSTAINLSYNLSNYQSLPYGAYIQCTVKARARGYAGPSDWVQKTFYVGYPYKPTVTKITIKDKRTTTPVLVGIKTNTTAAHPITHVELQALANVDYATVAEVEAASDAWTQVGATDDGACTALGCLVGDLACDPGKHSWVRAKSWYLVESVLVAYSAPMEAKALYVEAVTETDDSVDIIGSSSGADGTTAVVQLAWAKRGTRDDSTGTELSWSDQLDAWRSTDEPNTFELTYDDGPVSHGGKSYASSATISIKGLDEGATTYVKARRYKETDSGTVFGPYGNTATVIPSVAPASVVLEAPAFVPEGQGIACRWTFSGGSTQTAWKLKTSAGKVVASGTDAIGAATIAASRAESVAVDGTLTLIVSVSTGGAWVSSEPVTVHIVGRPDVTVTPSATYTAQPIGLPVVCETPDASLAIIVTSRGTDGDGPAGMVMQAEGDVVWSGVVYPTWSSGAATVTLPSGLALIDGTEYDVSMTATDPATGLASDEATGTFAVAWSHQAPDPDGFVMLTPIDTVDAAGNHVQAVTLTMEPPTGSVATDVYDIYRLTGDGAQLIGESWPLESTATDQYAPFGAGMEHAYRVACRTADGDVSWADFAYTMGGSSLRIDWQGGTVELPYNIAISDGYSKDVDVHRYLDGSTDAFYNQGIRRTAQLATSVLRLDDADTIAAVKELAHFVGPAFVRTPDGSAYEADVQVSDLTPTYELSAVTINATEVALTPAYALPPLEAEEETEG